MADSETIALLKSIDQSLRALVAIHRGKTIREERAKPADDKDLDGPHGDPVLKAKNPRDYVGPSMVGRKMSECPPEYLDLLADRYDYFASMQDVETPEGAKKAHYNKLDAARARGWALRIRSGKHQQQPRADPEEWS